MLRSLKVGRDDGENGGDDRGGLRGLAKNASTRAALAQIMVRTRPNDLIVEQRTDLLISRSVVELSKRPTEAIREILG